MRCWRATHRIQAAIGEQRPAADLLGEAEREIYALGQSARRDSTLTIADSAHQELDRLAALAGSDRDVIGLTSGFRDLDELLGGLQDGNLIVLAARPSMGKSTLGFNIADHVAARERAPTLFCSLEMSTSEIARRFFAAEAGIDGDRLRKGRVRDGDWATLYKAGGVAEQLPLTLLDDSDLSVADIRAHARRIAHRHGRLGLVVVDYLQLLRADQERPDNRTEEVSQFSRGLKRLARELSCPVLALAQLNRAVEQRNDKRPLLSDLRESGSIEADADSVLMLYRDDYYHPRIRAPERDRPAGAQEPARAAR